MAWVVVAVVSRLVLARQADSRAVVGGEEARRLKASRAVSASRRFGTSVSGKFQGCSGVSSGWGCGVEGFGKM